MKTPIATIHAAWHALPAGDLTDITGAGRILILAPHPDDESLGCGGLIAALCAAGRPPLVAILTDGGASHPNSAAVPPAQLRKLRARETRNAAAQLGLAPDHLVFLEQRDGAAPHAGAAFEAVVTRLCALVDPKGAICTSWELDPHCDHLAAWKAGRAVAQRTGARLLAYPVWGWAMQPPTEIDGAEAARAGWRLDIASMLAAKRAAVACHRSQFGKVIMDDPTGFSLPPALLDELMKPYEIYLLGDC